MADLVRDTLPGTRKAITRRFQLPRKLPDGTVEIVKIYFTIGCYEDGRPGEIFIKIDRQGSLASGALDSVAMMMSIGLQYGIPLHVLLEKLRHSRFEPEGFTRDPEFPSATSVLDLLAQWLLRVFPPPDGQ
jgi:ribonucleoside-diphosphate reductase alpha chain